MTVKERYEGLKAKVVKRKKEFDEFIEFLETKTTWLTSPASTRYHFNKEGGLLEHCVGVTETLLKLRDCLAPQLSDETCVIVALLHDTGKLGMPGKPYYLPNDDQWQIRNRNMKYKTNPDVVKMGMAVRSLYLIAQYIPLSDSEAQAITYHDGQYIDENSIVANCETPLTLILQFADNWTAKVLEEGKEIS